MRIPHDLTGKRFGRLVAISRTKNKHGVSAWLCVCDCGNEKVVRTDHLESGDIKSCGCLFDELNHKTARKHGLSEDPLYNRFTNIVSRCESPTNPEYKNYGGRGISICDEWRNDFKAFYNWSMQNGYKKELSIDRIDVNGDYEPNNCRWVDNIVQANNTRSNHFIEYNGERKTIAEWGRKLGISYSGLWRKLKAHKWSMEDVIKDFYEVNTCTNTE